MIDSLIEIRDKLKVEIQLLYDGFLNAGVSSKGDYSNTIREKEQKLDFIQNRIDCLSQAKTPDELDIRIFVLTNYKNVIQQHIPKKILKKIPDERYSDRLEDWIPYQSDSKPIHQTISEFKEREGLNFKVFYIDGQQDVEKWHCEIDDAITENSAIAIIDLLGINNDNIDLAKRFDTKIIKLSICPICTNLDQDIRNFMEKKSKEIFKASTLRMNKDRCCYFSTAFRKEHMFQELWRIFPSIRKIKNHIKDIDSTKDTELRTLNFKLR